MPLVNQNRSFQRSFQDGMEVWGTFRSNKITKYFTTRSLWNSSNYFYQHCTLGCIEWWPLAIFWEKNDFFSLKMKIWQFYVSSIVKFIAKSTYKESYCAILVHFSLYSPFWLSCGFYFHQWKIFKNIHKHLNSL